LPSNKHIKFMNDNIYGACPKTQNSIS